MILTSLIFLLGTTPDGHEFDFVVIDFPQCVSIEHPDAKEYFDRDVQGIRNFFSKNLDTIHSMTQQCLTLMVTEMV